MAKHDDDAENPRVSLNLIPQEALSTQEFHADSAPMPLFAVPKDRVLINVADHIKAYEKLSESPPKRRRGVFMAADVESLRNWLMTNGKDAPIFAKGLEAVNGEWKAPKLALIAIANYSVGGNKPAWHDFRAEYHFPVSAAWSAWSAVHGQWQKQADFASFVEDRIYDLAIPAEGEELSEPVTRFLEAAKRESAANIWATPSELYRLSRELEIAQDAKLMSKVNLQSGESKLIYTTENKDMGGNPIAVPSMFFIRAPVFFGLPPMLIGARLRYRAANGSVSWQVTLFAPDMIVREAFMAAAHDIGGEHVVYFGSPDYPPA